MLGLRGRLIAAMLAIAILTLAVAAVALISPLGRRLRADALSTLTAQADAARPALQDALDESHPGRSLRAAIRLLRQHTGAEVAIVGRNGMRLASGDFDVSARFAEAERALRTNRSVAQIVTSAGADEARVAVVLSTDRPAAALVLRKSLEEVAAATSVVRDALVTAGLIGLAAALVLGTALATRLVRRLRSLRATALRVAEIGPGVEMRPDSGHDEVGDLSQALATMQENLRAQEEARRTFVSTASHELRTPLASLRLMLTNLTDELEAPTPDLADARNQARRADMQAARLTALANELLTLSRVDAGVPLRSELLDLSRLARTIAAEFEPRARERLVTLTVDEHERWAIADPDSVARVVRILVDNALRFAPQAGHVGVALVEGSSVALTVSDDGPGVPEPERERIFERFERGTAPGAEAGFGLGLAIGRELARRMNGDLRLEARSPGAHFTLVLPAAPQL